MTLDPTLLTEHIGQRPYIVFGASFSVDEEWVLWDGSEQSVTISDPRFMAALGSRMISVGAGDVILCTVKLSLRHGKGGFLHRDITVLSVDEYRPHPDRGEPVWVNPGPEHADYWETELPDSNEVKKLTGTELDDATLREAARFFMNLAVEQAQQGFVDKQQLVDMRSWFATLEVTAEAGDNLNEILSRRKGRRD